MSNKLKCTECEHEFKTTRGNWMKCPACGSVHVVFLPGSFIQRNGAVLLIVFLFLAALILLALILFKPAGGGLPEIREVAVDSIDRTITISAVASSPGQKLFYSIDNNKSGAYESPKFTNVPAGQYHVCVIYGTNPEDRIMWRGNPVIMPESYSAPSLPPPQVLGVEVFQPTSSEEGRIVVHAESACPVRYVLNDSVRQRGNEFTGMKPGRYYVSVIDSLGRIDLWSEHVVISPRPVRVNPEPVPCTNPDRDRLEAQINELFNGSRGDRDLQNEILDQFVSRRVEVRGSLLNTSESYTIYQYLYRQNIGLPGSIRVSINNLRFNQNCKITSIEIEENGTI